MSESETDAINDRPGRNRARQIAFVAVGLITIAVILLLMPMPMRGRRFSALGDLAHTPLFFGLTLVAVLLVQKGLGASSDRRTVLMRCAVTGSILFAFGAGMELVQHFAGRTAAVHDAVANGMGVLSGIAIFLISKRRSLWPGSNQIKPLLLIGVVAAFAIAWWTPIHMILDGTKQNNEFPILCAFDSKIEISRWYFRDSSGQITTEGVTDGSLAMKVTLPKRHSSVTLVELTRDWTQMETLEFDLLLPATSKAANVDFQISVLDQHHANYSSDVFDQVWTLQRGEAKHFRISRQMILDGPESRETDLSQIKYFTISLGGDLDVLPMPVEFILDAVKLTLSK